MSFSLLEQTATFPSSRHEALAQLRRFVPRAGRYARERNRVVPGHPHVSRLSPSLRHGLLHTRECVEAVRERFAPSTVEKFTQELHWRRYWKAWLALRPQLWADYLRELRQMQDDPALERMRARATACMRAESNISLMNHFARELTSTGYLHNHARMWFAGWWIHVERLPWQLGAEFFQRHLLDADPASNTLSWRWVAGLQTPGKTYLPRRSNIEKYVDAEILDRNQEGLELLERPQPCLPDTITRPAITRPDPACPTSPPDNLPDRCGLWIHTDDLCPEVGPLRDLNPSSILVTGSPSLEEETALRSTWLRSALADAAQRAQEHFGITAEEKLHGPLCDRLRNWIRDHDLQCVVTFDPDIGPLNTLLPAIEKVARDAGARLLCVQRPEYASLRPLATGGFFPFWKKCQSVIPLLRR